MPKTNLKAAKTVLLDLRSEISRVWKETLREPTPSHDAGDFASMVAEKESAAGMVEKDRLKDIQIGVALGRIDDGSYETCLACEGAISPKRLAAVPWTPFCISCQEKLDQDKLPGFEHLAAPSLPARRISVH